MEREIQITAGDLWRRKKPEASSLLDDLLVLKVTSFIAKIEFFYKSVLNLKTSCKAQEGWKKHHRGAFFCLIPSWPSTKAKKGKTNLFCFVFEEVKSSCAGTQDHQRTSSRKQKKSSEVRGSLLDVFLLYPDQQTSSHYWQSKSWLLAFSKCSQEYWERAPSQHHSPLPVSCHINITLWRTCVYMSKCVGS